MLCQHVTTGGANAPDADAKWLLHVYPTENQLLNKSPTLVVSAHTPLWLACRCLCGSSSRSRVYLYLMVELMFFSTQLHFQWYSFYNIVKYVDCNFGFHFFAGTKKHMILVYHINFVFSGSAILIAMFMVFWWCVNFLLCFPLCWQNRNGQILKGTLFLSIKTDLVMSKSKWFENFRWNFIIELHSHMHLFVYYAYYVYYVYITHISMVNKSCVVLLFYICNIIDFLSAVFITLKSVIIITLSFIPTGFCHPQRRCATPHMHKPRTFVIGLKKSMFAHVLLLCAMAIILVTIVVVTVFVNE